VVEAAPASDAVEEEDHVQDAAGNDPNDSGDDSSSSEDSSSEEKDENEDENEEDEDVDIEGLEDLASQTYFRAPFLHGDLYDWCLVYLETEKRCHF
jgi:hypothetical protein